MIYAFYLLIIGIILVGINICLNRKDFIKSNEEHVIRTLHFKNNPSAFDYALNYWSPPWCVGQVYVGLLLEDSDCFFKRNITIRVAAEGNKDVIALASVAHIKDNLKKGNLVYWILCDALDVHSNGKEKVMPSGIVIAILEPSLNVQSNTWNIRKSYSILDEA